jgi:hypothetical protein
MPARIDELGLSPQREPILRRRRYGCASANDQDRRE